MQGEVPEEEEERRVVAQLEEHLRRLWDHHEVPPWHRKLFERRFFGEGSCGSATLRREAEDLVAGCSRVQAAVRAVAAREAVLARLSELRDHYEDADFAKLGPRRELSEALLALRCSSVSAVEAVAAWRRSVAPPPGRRGSSGQALRAVASPCARGARWPPPSGGQGDYLQRLAQDDSVVRRFEAVLELKPEGETDPFLLLTASAAKSMGKLRPPTVQSSQRQRVEIAHMHLLEDLIGFSLAGDWDAVGSPTSSQRGDGDLCASPQRASVVVGAGATSPSRGMRQTLVVQKIERLLPFLAAQHQARKSIRPPVSKKASVLDGFVAKTASRNTRRCATITMRKADSLTNNGALSLIPELNDLNSNTSGFLWKPKTTPGHAKVPLSLPLRGLSRESSLSGDLETRDDDEESTEKSTRPPTIDLMRINATFRRYSAEGYVYQESLTDCLKLLGFPYPNMEWSEQALYSVTSYGVLDAGEFMLFISAYEDRMRVHVMDDFRRYDEDGSGSLEKEEFEKLFCDLQVEPMSHVLEEILAEVDQDGSGTLDFDEFFDVIRLLQEREGFSKSEHDTFLNAFRLFDRDKSGEMDEQGLYQVLRFLGYEVTPEDASAVTREVDFDGAGTIDQHEFLVCMRKLREREIQSLKKAMTMNDLDKNGTINADELQTILYGIGYMPDDVVISEVLEDLGVDSKSSELNFNLLWQFMTQLRKREGLCRADIEAVNMAFARYCTGTEVSVGYISKIMRFMGFSMSFDERQELIVQVDIDRSGALGLVELRKLFRICREQRAKAIKEAFKTYASCFGNNEFLVAHNTVPEALRNIGCLRERKHLPAFEGENEDGLNMQQFFKLARKLFLDRELEIRSNGGYCDHEVASMGLSFREFDVDGSGSIHNHELVNLVKTIFPEMATDPKLRPQVKEIIREADADGNGELDFEDFLRLMSTVYELRSKNQLEKEKKAVTETRLLPHEVHDFRELFQAHADSKTMLLEFPSLEGMLSNICPMGDKNLHSLFVLWREALAVYLEHGDVREVDINGGIDFPEFLWLMRQVIDTNFANVNDRTRKSRVLETQASKAQTEDGSRASFQSLRSADLTEAA